jgi:type VI secretion system secreted protein Hcp
MALVDYFLKIEGVDGESPDASHGGEIQIESFSWGETNSGTHAAGGGGGAGKVSMQDFHFVMQMCKATPVLMLKCASGEHIPSAQLTCRKAGTDQQEFLKIKFTDLLVSSYQTGGSAHGDIVPMDQVSMNFTKIEFEYAPQKADGTLDSPVTAGWDLKKNQKV